MQNTNMNQQIHDIMNSIKCKEDIETIKTNIIISDETYNNFVKLLELKEKIIIKIVIDNIDKDDIMQILNSKRAVNGISHKKQKTSIKNEPTKNAIITKNVIETESELSTSSSSSESEEELSVARTPRQKRSQLDFRTLSMIDHIIIKYHPSFNGSDSEKRFNFEDAYERVIKKFNLHYDNDVIEKIKNRLFNRTQSLKRDISILKEVNTNAKKFIQGEKQK